MSLRPEPIRPVPEETARVARAAFPKGIAYTSLRDELGTIFEDGDFSDLFPSRLGHEPRDTRVPRGWQKVAGACARGARPGLAASWAPRLVTPPARPDGNLRNRAD